MKNSELLKRQRCLDCGTAYATVCLYNGYCSDCSSFWRVKTYDISRLDYKAMSQSQNNTCAICKKEAFLVIDHDHQTGKVRGLLCKTCNSTLGGFNDSFEWLEEACRYLHQAREKDLLSELENFQLFNTKSTH